MSLQKRRPDRGDDDGRGAARAKVEEPPAPRPPQPLEDKSESSAGVLLISTQLQALKILYHFGPPDTSKRHPLQQLFAVPCQLCNGNSMAQWVEEVAEKGYWKLVKSLRNDLGETRIRDFMICSAMQKIGPNIQQMEGRYCIVGLAMPFGWEDILEVRDYEPLRHWRQEVCNYMDILVTAVGGHHLGEDSLRRTAQRALRDKCRISVADPIWEPEVQHSLRKSLGADIPLTFSDERGVLNSVLVLPEDTPVVTTEDGFLCFGEAPPTPSPAPASFRHSPSEPLQEISRPPPGWTMWLSQSRGVVYYFNEITRETTFQLPLHEPLR